MDTFTRHGSCLGLLGAICLCLSAVAAEHPIYRMFPDEVTFHLSFDREDCVADMACGQNEPLSIKGTPSFAPGVFGGRALVTGHPVYSALQNMDLSAEGTLIFWISPMNWPTTKPADGIEPGFTSFEAMGGDYQYIVGKMWGQPWQRAGHFNIYVQYLDGKTSHVNCIRYGNASIAGTQKEGIRGPWRNGEWRMVVSTWSPGTFTNSLNGLKSEVSGLKKLLSKPTEWFKVGTTEPDLPYRFRTDEVVILDKVLSDEDIARLYEASLKQMSQEN